MDWKNESIGVIKKALRSEIGQQTGAPTTTAGKTDRKTSDPTLMQCGTSISLVLQPHQ